MYKSSPGRQLAIINWDFSDLILIQHTPVIVIGIREDPLVNLWMEIFSALNG